MTPDNERNRLLGLNSPALANPLGMLDVTGLQRNGLQKLPGQEASQRDMRRGEVGRRGVRPP